MQRFLGMRKFLNKFGIRVKYDKPINNIKTNVFLSFLEVIYFGVSLYNLGYAQSISGVTVILNCLSFFSLMFLNFRNELDRLDDDDRYSLYFFMFLAELLIALALASSFIVFGIAVERLKTLLFVMLVVTVIDKFVKIIINMYAEE